MTAGIHPAARAERERNGLLRRVDWRWLLPHPEVEHAIARVDEDLAEALPAVAAHLHALQDTIPAGADLAVLVDPRTDDLVRARRALRADGALYVEVRRPRPGGLAASLRHLRGAGFVPTAVQWCWPPATRALPGVWLPVDAPAAVEWLRHRRPADGGAIRARRVVADRAFSLARRVGALAPLCIVARPAESGTAPWLSGLLDDHGHGGGHPAWLLLTGGRRSHNKVVALPFREGSLRPDLAVKVGRVAEADAGLLREARALRALVRSPPSASALAPQVLFLHAAGAGVAVGQSLEEGVALLSELTSRSYARIAGEVTDRLIELALATCGVDALSPHPVALAAARDFARSYASALPEAQGAAAAAVARQLPALPTVMEQRDCSPWNLLRRPRGGLVMLDWESAEPAGLPLLDLVYFLTFAGLHLHGAIRNEPERRYRDVWGDTPEGRVNAACVARYLAALGLPGTAAGPLRRLTWMVHAEVEVERLAADGGRGPASADLAGGVFLRLLRADVAMGV
ncbi:MAG TPA: hypothetical protein VNT51_07865 [Miltoncostaeaceae bacterium]|nr:hypothetical protein [Miltoncostaeaceae bacterium]